MTNRIESCDSIMGTEFQFGTEEHDQSTFLGRLTKFMSIVNPANLAYSGDEIRVFQALLEKSKNEFGGKKVEGHTDIEMWQAQTLVESAIHPDTNELVPKPFRMCGYVPCNIPILVGLLVPQSVAMTAFWQWLNQTHNALINYANRNAKTPVTAVEQVAGYTLAVTSAMGVSYLGNRTLARHGERLFRPTTLANVKKVVPFLAVGTASSLNTISMRNAELTSGIEVMSPTTKEVYGSSQVAAKEAIGLTALSRVAISAGCMLVPPLAMTILERRNLINATLRPRQHLIVHTVVCGIAFMSVLPVAIALFPQQGSLQTSKLETDLSAKIKEDYVLYNKGL